MTRPTGWAAAYEIELTIDNTNIDSDLSDFIVAVNFSASSGITDKDVSSLFDVMTNADRKKCKFYLSDKETPCIASCEVWDDTNKIATYHVKVPVVTTAATTVLYAYFDPEADDQDAPLIAEYSDDFTGTDGAAPDTAIWTRDPFSNTNSFSIQSNVLQFSANSEVAYDLYMNNIRLGGDFDVQMDFEVISFDANTDFNFFLVIADYDWDVSYSAGWAGYTSGNKTYNGIGTTTATTDTSGTIRVTRAGSVIKAYYHDGTDWVTIDTEELGSTAPLYPWIIGSTTLATSCVINIDNFTINSAAETTFSYVTDTGALAASEIYGDEGVAVLDMAQTPVNSTESILSSSLGGGDWIPTGMDSADLITGTVGDALDFDGVDDILTSADNFDVATTQSWEFFGKLTRLSGSGSAAIMGKATDEILFTYDGDSAANANLVSCLVANPTDGVTATVLSTTAITTGADVHIVGVYSEATSLKLYINGVLEDTETTVPDDIEINSTPALVGIDSDTSLSYGEMSAQNVRIFAKELSADYVKASYYNLSDALVTFGDVVAAEVLTVTIDDIVTGTPDIGALYVKPVVSIDSVVADSPEVGTFAVLDPPIFGSISFTLPGSTFVAECGSAIAFDTPKPLMEVTATTEIVATLAGTIGKSTASIDAQADLVAEIQLDTPQSTMEMFTGTIMVWDCPEGTMVATAVNEALVNITLTLPKTSILFDSVTQAPGKISFTLPKTELEIAVNNESVAGINFAVPYSQCAMTVDSQALTGLAFSVPKTEAVFSGYSDSMATIQVEVPRSIWDSYVPTHVDAVLKYVKGAVR